MQQHKNAGRQVNVNLLYQESFLNRDVLLPA